MIDLALAEASEGLDCEDLAHFLQLVSASLVRIFKAIPTAHFVKSKRLNCHLLPQVSHLLLHGGDLIEDVPSLKTELLANLLILASWHDDGLELLELMALDALPGF